MGAPFIVVMSVLVVLSLYAMSMSIRSQGASNQVRKAQANETCEELARLVLEEAVYRMRSMGSAEDNDIARLLHTPGAGGSLSLGTGVLPRSQEEIARYQGDYSCDGVDVEVLRWSPVAVDPSEAAGYEAVGMFRVSTRVHGPKETSIYHEAEFGYRTALTSVPRPFDTFTFYLDDPETLLTAGAFRDDPNQTIQWAATMLATGKKSLEDSLTHIQTALDDARDKRSKAHGSDKDKLDTAIAALTALDLDIRNTLSPSRWAATPDWTVLGPGEASLGLENTLHLFLRPLVLYSFEPEVDLGALNLPARVGGLVQEIFDRTPQMKAAAQGLKAAEASGSSNPMAFVAAQKIVLELIEKDVAAYHGVLSAYKAFQDQLIEAGGSDLVEIRKRADRLTPAEARRRACFRFEGEGQAEEAEKFLGARPAPSGVVFVDDPTATLKLRVEELRGRLVVYSKGPVDIQRAKVVTPDEDLLVCLSPSPMRVLQDGGQMALVAMGESFQGSGTSFEGSLLLWDLSDRGAIDRTLKGTLKRQKSIQTSENLPLRPEPEVSTVHVAIGPVALYRRTTR